MKLTVNLALRFLMSIARPAYPTGMSTQPPCFQQLTVHQDAYQLCIQHANLTLSNPQFAWTFTTLLIKELVSAANQHQITIYTYPVVVRLVYTLHVIFREEKKCNFYLAAT